MKRHADSDYKYYKTVIPFQKYYILLKRIKRENMKLKYVITLGLLSGLVSVFLFMSLDFYFFLYGPARIWFTPFNIFILPIIVALFVVNIVSHKFSFREKIYSNFISGITAYIGSILIISALENIALLLRP